MKAPVVVLAALTLLLATGVAARADDAAAARLLAEGRAAEAAELFEDPAWKGIALFRSDQLPRAASAFARAGDAASLHNLGNVYVILGYPALALEAYQRSLALDPADSDTRANLALVLEDLRHRKGQGDAENEADQRLLATLEPEAGKEAGAPPPRDAGQQSPQAEEASKSPPPPSGGGTDERPQGSGGAGGGESRQAEAPPGEAPSSAGQGRETQADAGQETAAASGRPEAAAVDGAPPRSARQALAETRLATQHWLAGIEDGAAALAARRIAAESARRRARTGPLPEPEDPW